MEKSKKDLKGNKKKVEVKTFSVPLMTKEIHEDNSLVYTTDRNKRIVT